MAKGYNGWPSWNQWNVALWVRNDEGLYRLARECRRETRNLDEAARLLLEYLPGETPDGAKFNLTSVKGAIRDL